MARPRFLAHEHCSVGSDACRRSQRRQAGERPGRADRPPAARDMADGRGETKALKTGQPISWLRLVDECNARSLGPRFFPQGNWNQVPVGQTRRMLRNYPRSTVYRRDCGWITARPGVRGAICRPIWRCGDRPGRGHALESSESAPGKRRGGTIPRNGSAPGRAECLQQRKAVTETLG